MVFMMVAGMTRTGSAISLEFGPDHSAAVKPAVADVAISWQVRSVASVHLRLYRQQLSGKEIVVYEVIAEPGIMSFEFVDDRRPAGNALYVLRVLGTDGSETTLGSALCVELKFAPGIAASGWTPSQHACTLETTELPTPEWAPLVGSIASSGGGWVPAPEPPVPRLS